MHQRNHSFAGILGAITLAVSFGAAADTADSPEAEVMPVKSLFYTQEEMKAVRHALTTYVQYASIPRDNSEPEDFLSVLGRTNPPPARKIQKKPAYTSTYTYPQFFLESLAYHSPADWMVRINHQKITTREPLSNQGSLRVLNVDKDSVSLEWTPKKLDGEKIKKAARKAHDQDISVDQNHGVITFTLHANQTFSSYAMRILEGKARPVTINATEAADNSDLGAR
jgi:hypothetical protein